MNVDSETSPRCLYVCYWDPETHGMVPGNTANVFCLTTQENQYDSGITPEIIIACVYINSGTQGNTAYFLTWDTFPLFVRQNPALTFVVFNIGQTFAALAPTFEDPMELYNKVIDGQVVDVHIMGRLTSLALEGNPASFASISTCLSETGGPKQDDLHDFCLSPPNIDRFIDAPDRIPPKELCMAVRASQAISQLYEQQQSLGYGIPDMTDSSAHFALPDMPEWLQEQQDEYGVLTHDIQVWADIVYTTVHHNGVHIDLNRVNEQLEQLEFELTNLLQQMVEYGYEYNPDESVFCNDASAQLVLESYGQENDIAFVVKGGKLSLAKADLEPFTGQCGFIPLYLQAKELDKRLRYLDKMNQERLHPKYNILATTGRVYAHGDLAIQSLPCGGGIRECIVPAPGHVFVIVDYVMLEMVILAQALMRQFGYKSNLAELINTGGDIHRKVAAMIFNKDEANITGEERNYAKVLNFGIPGGLGATSLAKNARDFGLEWDDAESKQMRERWLDIFPEVKAFLNGYSQNPEGVWTGTGRYRKTSKYTELRNTVFQGLGADGMNLALKRLWLGGYRIVAVIHDEVLIEVAECEDYTEVVADIERLMIEGMQQIAPDMLIRVEFAVSTCWSKKAVKTYDEDGRLVAWSPDTSLDISCPMERTGITTV